MQSVSPAHAGAAGIETPGSRTSPDQPREAFQVSTPRPQQPLRRQLGGTGTHPFLLQLLRLLLLLLLLLPFSTVTEIAIANANIGFYYHCHR